MPSAAALEAERKVDLEALRPLSEAEGLSPEEFQYRDGILIKVAMSLPQMFNEQVKSDPAYAASWVQHQPKPVRYITFAGEDGYIRGKALVDKLASEFGGFWVDYVEVRKANISEKDYGIGLRTCCGLKALIFGLIPVMTITAKIPIF
ncbi:MAG: hypothetical protein ABL925_13770 [Methylococcales bacterium]